ncbi:MAG: DUF4189 domain-containing protein [Methylotenera sp.]
MNWTPTKIAWLAVSLLTLAACGRTGEEARPPTAAVEQIDGIKAVAAASSNAEKTNAVQSHVKFGSFGDTQGVYGAIALVTANNQAIGYLGYDEPDEATARELALEGCQDVAGDAGSGCKVQLVFRNGCGAYASAPGGGYGTGWGKSPARACDWALKTCKDFNQGCSASTFVCSPGGKQGSCSGGLTIEDGKTTIHLN